MSIHKNASEERPQWEWHIRTYAHTRTRAHKHAHLHTHTLSLSCVCVCVCVCERENVVRFGNVFNSIAVVVADVASNDFWLPDLFCRQIAVCPCAYSLLSFFFSLKSLGHSVMSNRAAKKRGIFHFSFVQKLGWTLQSGVHVNVMLGHILRAHFCSQANYHSMITS